MKLKCRNLKNKIKKIPINPDDHIEKNPWLFKKKKKKGLSDGQFNFQNLSDGA